MAKVAMSACVLQSNNATSRSESNRAYGGAISNSYGNLSMSGCVLLSNAVASESYRAYGGAIYNGYGDVAMSGCVLESNVVTSLNDYAVRRCLCGRVRAPPLCVAVPRRMCCPMLTERRRHVHRIRRRGDDQLHLEAQLRVRVPGQGRRHR